MDFFLNKNTHQLPIGPVPRMGSVGSLRAVTKREKNWRARRLRFILPPLGRRRQGLLRLRGTPEPQILPAFARARRGERCCWTSPSTSRRRIRSSLRRAPPRGGNPSPFYSAFFFFWVPIDLRGWSGCQVLSSIFGQLYFWRVWSGLE